MAPRFAVDPDNSEWNRNVVFLGQRRSDHSLSFLTCVVYNHSTSLLSSLFCRGRRLSTKAELRSLILMIDFQSDFSQEQRKAPEPEASDALLYG